ncbi:hypothetical protein FRX31_009872 [Thalictrum thalictroides]|uniref:Uncharacterized protein n=1 Tax=Thalictrum thalictroides TaxID=46969 RepID=A0A7J6WT07_THATH|nr:hypothetical protein FRX31_009872 [Thalictrum thalictroides]
MDRLIDIRIRDIKGQNFNWRITARIMSVWKQVDEKTKKTTNLDMILIDEHGDKIHAKVNSGDIDDFKENIIQGKIITLNRFKTWNITRGPRVTNQTRIIYIQQYTKLAIVEEENEKIPMFNFEFTEFSEVPFYCEEENKEIYIGICHVQSTYATRILLDQEIPEVTDFKLRMEGIASANNDNIRTISQIFDMVDEGVELEKDVFKCTAKIMEVFYKTEWHYLACKKCRRKIEITDEEEYFCKKCDKVVEEAMELYKLGMDIEDGKSIMMVTGFDEVIKNIFDLSVYEMLNINQQDNGEKKLKSIFDQLIGKTTSFHIKIKEYNLKTEDTYSMSVIKIEEIPELKPTTTTLEVFTLQFQTPKGKGQLLSLEQVSSADELKEWIVNLVKPAAVQLGLSSNQGEKFIDKAFLDVGCRNLGDQNLDTVNEDERERSNYKNANAILGETLVDHDV